MNRLNNLSCMIVNAISAMVAAAEQRFAARCGEKKYFKHGEHVAFRHPSRKTVSAAQLKRAAKKRANIRARSKK